MSADPSHEPEPDSPLLRVGFALLAAALFRYAVFAEVSNATTADEKAQEHLQALVESAQRANRDGRYEDALPPLEELTRLRPKNHVYWWERARAYEALHRPQDEIDALEQFVGLSPLPAEACPRLPRLYDAAGKKREALDAFRRCASFSPYSTENVFYFGHAYELQGELDKALEVYTEALRREPNGDVEAGVGRVLLRKGQPEAAERAVAATLARNPNNVDALLVAGLALMRQNKLDDAKKLLDRGVAQHDNTDLRYALGVLAEAKGQLAEAAAQYAAALRLDPGNAEAAARRARLGGGGAN